MGVPEYYYAPPRLYGTALPQEQVKKQAGAWSVMPNNALELITALSSVGAAAGFNLKIGNRPVPAYTGIWKLALAYGFGLAFARWADRTSITHYSYEDKVVRDYMELYPNKFPEYKPRMIKETFGSWIPIRSGSASKISDVMAFGRKKESEIYVPNADEPLA